ncbi:MAG: hypothetical protein KGQ77_12570, partial [Betaproteobacteria bacterium]|nr:hypothetical protein [Betaproteobacteria bacterium]
MRAPVCVLLAAVLSACAVPAVRAPGPGAQPLPATRVEPTAAAPAAGCPPSPWGARGLYLRGSFNGWAAPEAQRFGYACGRYQLVTQLRGTQRFKIADDAWSKDA